VVLAHARMRPADYFLALEAWRHMDTYADSAASGELPQRNFFHWAAAQSVGQAAIVDNPARADVNAVMSVAAPWCDEVCPQRRLTMLLQQRVVASARGTDNARVVFIHSLF
jgi:hypothetical protein